MLIDFQSLPVELQNGISKEQQSYIDEFFFRHYIETDTFEAWYAGEIIAVSFDGKVWENDGEYAKD